MKSVQCDCSRTVNSSLGRGCDYSGWNQGITQVPHYTYLEGLPEMEKNTDKELNKNIKNELWLHNSNSNSKLWLVSKS